jgi:hypothetical protein
MVFLYSDDLGSAPNLEAKLRARHYSINFNSNLPPETEKIAREVQYVFEEFWEMLSPSPGHEEMYGSGYEGYEGD